MAIAYDTTACPGSVPKTRYVQETAFGTLSFASTFDTAGAATLVVLCIGATGVGEAFAPATLAWTGSTPANATTWTKQGEATWASPGANFASVAVWTATCSAALSGVNVTLTRGGSGDDGASAILALYALTGAGAVGSSSFPAAFNPNNTIDIRTTLASVTAASFLVWGGASGDAPATPLTAYSGTTIDAQSDVNESYFSVAVGHIANSSAGSVTIGATASDQWSITAALEIKEAAAAVTRTFTESATATETQGRGLATNRTVTESTTASDSAAFTSNAPEKQSSFTETATTSETFALSVGRAVTVTETATATETVSHALPGALSLSFSETTYALDAFPGRLAARGFYFTLDGAPRYIVGETCWFMGVNNPQSVRQAYFADRAARGFTHVAVMALVHAGYYAGAAEWVESNVPATADQADMGTYRNVHPWSNTGDTGDFSKLDQIASGHAGSAYWTNLQNLVDDANAEGVFVQIVPSYLGYGRFAWDNASCQGWYDEICNSGCTRTNAAAEAVYGKNTQAAMFAYGRFIASLMEGKDVLWMTDGDTTPSTVEAKARMRAIRDGIRSVTPNAIFASETEGAASTETDPDVTYGTSTPSDYTPYDDDLDVESFYGYDDASSSYWSDTAHRARVTEYRTGNARRKPAWVTEARYAYDTYGVTEETARQCIWSSVLGGGLAGHVQSVYTIFAALPRTDMSSQFARYGVLQHLFVRDIITSIPNWYELEPATADGTYLTAARGYAEIISTQPAGYTNLTRVIGAITAGGESAVIYVPNTGSGTRSFDVDMSLFSGSRVAIWYNPRACAVNSVEADLVAASGTHTFTTPAANNGTAGEDAATTNDWVLVLTAPLSFSESATPTEIVQSRRDASLTVTETATTSETFACALAASKTISETATATETEAAVLVATWERSFSDAATATELQARGLAVTATVTETVTATETLGRAVGILSFPTDSATATEALARAGAASATFTELATAMEQVERSVASTTTATETATATETIAFGLWIDRAVSDTATTSEMLDRAMAVAIQFAELPTTATDVVGYSLSSDTALSTSINEAATASEDVATGTATPISLLEVLTASDTVRRAVAFSLAETLTATDSASYFLESPWAMPLSEFSTLTDTWAVEIDNLENQRIRETATATDSVRLWLRPITLPGPKPVRYWRDADLDKLRAAILQLDEMIGTLL